ncbi:MAG: ArsR family transcriptional regulator [Desulfurococcales archaeon]|nr:ArsR family transcriptional regulator [Desulfurococcales archaeon]
MSAADEKILTSLEENPKTISELVEETGYSRSWIWRRLKKLEKMGVVLLEKKGGIVKARLAKPLPATRSLIRVGIPRAAEYPYILPFRKKLLAYWDKVEITVFDDPFQLASLVAQGKVHLAMLPAVTALLVHRVSGGQVHIIGGGSGGGAGVIFNPHSRREAHITTMASSMEYCAVKEKLPGERLYAHSGVEILESVRMGRVMYGVVWSPYLEEAKRYGLKIEKCDLPACCVLTANASLRGLYTRIGRLFEESVTEARRKLESNVLISAYSRLIGVQRPLLAEAVHNYTFYEEPPLDVLERAFEHIRLAALPRRTVRDAVAR